MEWPRPGKIYRKKRTLLSFFGHIKNTTHTPARGHTNTHKPRHDVILKVFSSNLWRLDPFFSATHQLWKEPYACSRRSSMLAPGNKCHRQARSTSHACKKYSCQTWSHIHHACMANYTMSRDTMAEEQNSLPTPWCHVCIWSGGLSQGPPPGRVCKVGAGCFTAEVHGLSVTQAAVRFMLYHS